MQFEAEIDRNQFFLWPSVVIVRGEHEDTGEPAGIMIAFGFLCFTASITFC